MQAYKPLWWSLSDNKERAAALTQTVGNLERTQSERRLRTLRNVQIYEGRKLEGLFPSAYFSSFEYSSDQYDAMRLNLARSLVQTAVAKIAGKQRPKAQFCVSDADWTVKRKAKKIERFIEAVQLQRQGAWQDAWAVGLLAFRDACVCDMGVLKFTADTVERKVCIERVLPWEIYVDPFEARTGQPKNLFHVYGYDRYALVERFPKYKGEIMDAPSLEEDVRGAEIYGTGSDVARMVRVREGWRLPISKDKPGVHSLIVGESDLTDGEDYTRAFHTFEFTVWESFMIGMHGASLVDNVANICEELNASAQRWSDAERLCSNGVTFYEDGSIKEEDLEDNRIGIAIALQKGTQMPPTYTAPNAVSQASIDYMNTMKGLGYELSGVSQMSATGQKDSGVTAAVAMRTIENIGTERFAIQWQAYERMMAIGATRQIVACMRELADSDEGDVTVKWPGGGFFEELHWSDVDMEEEQYDIQVYAVSGLVNTPADRLQLASDLFDRQIISKEGYLRVIQAKDIDSEIDRPNKQWALIDKYMEQWRDATQEREDSGKFRYRPPIRWMNLEDAIVQVGQAFLDAEMDEAPDYNLDLFLRYLGDADALLQKKAAEQAALQAAAKGAAPMGAPVMAAPQMAPGAPGMAA